MWRGNGEAEHPREWLVGFEQRFHDLAHWRAETEAELEQVEQALLQADRLGPTQAEASSTWTQVNLEISMLDDAVRVISRFVDSLAEQVPTQDSLEQVAASLRQSEDSVLSLRDSIDSGLAALRRLLSLPRKQ